MSSAAASVRPAPRRRRLFRFRRTARRSAPARPARRRRHGRRRQLQLRGPALGRAHRHAPVRRPAVVPRAAGAARRLSALRTGRPADAGRLPGTDAARRGSRPGRSLSRPDAARRGRRRRRRRPARPDPGRGRAEHVRRRRHEQAHRRRRHAGRQGTAGADAGGVVRRWSSCRPAARRRTWRRGRWRCCRASGRSCWPGWNG